MTFFESTSNMIQPLEVRIASAKADLEFNVGQYKFTTGTKYVNVLTNNQFSFYDVVAGEEILNLDRSNDFTYEEEVFAGYATVNRKWKKWNVKLGLRAEQTLSEGRLVALVPSGNDTVTRSYLNLFPSAGITYEWNWKHKTALNYSERISRPNYSDLNPFEHRITELYFWKGNPFLQPKYTNSVKLSHTYKYRYTVSASYTVVRDFYAQITDTINLNGATEPNQAVMTTQNVADNHIFNLQLSLPIQIKDWWNVYTSLGYYNYVYRANTDEFQPVTQPNFSFYGQNTFTLPGDWTLELSGWYSSRSVWGGTYITQPLGSFNAGVGKRFLDNRLKMNLNINDIFYTNPWRGAMSYNIVSISGYGGWDSREIRLNLSYNFGNEKMKQVKLRKGGASDESGRLDG